jgi:serine/threonine-protein kinase
VVVRRADCKVRYQVNYDSGSDFGARLTVVNKAAHAVTGWRLDFAYPGTQRLAATKGVTQRGRKVALRARVDAKLNAGRSVTLLLRGAYREANPLPLAFTLDGHPCVAEVIGATMAPRQNATGPAPAEVAGAAGPKRTKRHDAGKHRPAPAPTRARDKPQPKVGTPPHAKNPRPKIDGLSVSV